MKFDQKELAGNSGSNNRNNGRRRDDRRDNRRDDRKNGRNRAERRDNQRQDNNDKRRSGSILSSGVDFERGSGDRIFEEDIEVKVDNEPEVSEEVERAVNTALNFLDDYADACKLAGNQVTDVIRDRFWDVCKVMTHYYDPKYGDMMGEMNKVLDVTCSQRFAASLCNLLGSEEVEGWNDGTMDVWKDVMFTIATTITTSHKKMKDETVSAYIELLSSSGLAGKDIDRLASELGITKDLATDLIISIPVIPDDMNDIALRQFFGSFVMRMMDHAEENIDVLDRGTQGKLFSFFFGKDHIALKAIGRMLAAPKISKFQNESQKMVYAEYLSMLSDRLDAYDIKDIKYVLRFIVNEKKRLGKGTEMLFGDLSIVEYNSVRKSVFELIKDDADAKQYLVLS